MKTEIEEKFLPHKIICLVGSTRPQWQNQYRNVNKELALAGYLVISVSMFKTDVKNIEVHRGLLESIHFQKKIRLADAVVLIHKDAVGKHTQIELKYCKDIGKPVVVFRSLEQTKKELKEVLA